MLTIAIVLWVLNLVCLLFAEHNRAWPINLAALALLTFVILKNLHWE